MSNSTPVAPIQNQPLLSALVPSITAINGQAVTSSIKIAEYFDKRHADVLRSIKNLGCSKEYRERNFASTLIDIAGPNNSSRKSSAYQVTKDGFVILVMGFTGKQAMQFKEAYINAFNEMERRLNKPEVAPSKVSQEELLLQIDEYERPELPKDLIQTIEYMSMQMALEAKQVAEEYLYRLVRYECIGGDLILKKDKALSKVKSSTLESALLYKQSALYKNAKFFADYALKHMQELVEGFDKSGHLLK